MLISLEIDGVAIIERVRIELHSGLNVLTGETGSGKSILIRALHILSGKKTSTDIIRAGKVQSSVTGKFLIRKNGYCYQLLKNLGLPPCRNFDHDLVVLTLRRTIVKSTGRSSSWINDNYVTVTAMKEVTKHLLDIFAQHDNQKLLNELNHQKQLDLLIDDTTLKENVQILWNKTKQTLKKIMVFNKKYEEEKKSLDYFEGRLKEIKKLNPEKSDYESTLSYCQQVEKNLSLRKKYMTVLDLLEKDHTNLSVSETLWRCTQILGETVNNSPMTTVINLWIERFSDLLKETEELIFEIRQQENRISDEADLFDSKQQRLADYQAIMRRLHCESCEEIIAEQTKLIQSIHFIYDAENTVSTLLSELLTCSRSLKQACDKLSAARHSAARKLESNIVVEFADLAMTHSHLYVEFSTYKSSPPEINVELYSESFQKKTKDLLTEVREILSCLREDGQDKIRFLLNHDSNKEAKPLANIASGGELSRIMLAMKKILISGESDRTLILDEIDTGISGKVASIVGKKLKEISSHRQVICISHLAQVAAWAGTHYCVKKTEERGTHPKIGVDLVILNEETKIKELARLLSGEQITKASLEQARSLQNHCRHSVI